MISIPDDNEIISRLSIAGSTPDSVANLLRCAGYNGMTGKAIRQRLIKLEKKTPLRKSAARHPIHMLGANHQITHR